MSDFCDIDFDDLDNLPPVIRREPMANVSPIHISSTTGDRPLESKFGASSIDDDLAPSCLSPYCYATMSNELATMDVHIEYIVDGLIPKGFITLLYAAGGMGKSTVLSQAMQAVADGEPFLGLKTIQSPVFYLDYENPDATLVTRLRKIGGHIPYPIWRSNADPAPPALDSDQQRSILFGLEPGTVLVIDTLKASNNAEENSAKEMKPIFDFLKQLRNHGLTIILLHHTNKGADGNYRGSSVIQDQSDHCLSLAKVKAAGSDSESEDENGSTYRLGTKGKTRAKPFRIFLEFNKTTEIFQVAADPDTPDIEVIAKAIAEICASNTEANQSAIVEVVTRQLGMLINANRVRSLLKKRDGFDWFSRKGLRNATVYSLSSLPGQFLSSSPYIGGDKLENWNLTQSEELKTEIINTPQTSIDTEFVSYSGESGKLEKLDLPAWARVR